MSQQKVLIIALVWPEPQTTAAGSRMLQLLQFFKSSNYAITVASTATESKLSFDLNNLEIDKKSIQLNHSSFDVFIADFNPAIVLFDRFITEEQFGWRVAEHAPNALRILNTEDLHSLRHVREKSFKKNIPFTINHWLNDDKTKREIASIYRSDLSLIISSHEIELLQNVLNIDKNLLLHLPFMTEKVSEKQISDWPTFSERKDFICIGNGKHAPNLDAIVWLKKEIWPLIHAKLPDSNLHIYGAYLPEFIKQMHRPKEGFLVHGWTEDKKTAFQKAKINLAPLRFGAGIKGKLVDSMTFGTPSITTSIGAEGMHDHLPWNGTIADEAGTFANAAVLLYRDKNTWQTAQGFGIEIIDEIYNSEKLHNRLTNAINKLFEYLITHRQRNFIGVMLQHHSLASTKFMSKWIAEKESKNN